MKMTLRQLQIFLRVVETGHLTSVARDLGLSQSAVSMSIKELENVIGRPLFDRINKKLILNELGRNFHQAIAPIYQQLEDIEYEFRNTVDKGTVRVGASTTIVDYLIPPIVCRYMGEYPGVKVSLKEGNTREISEMIKRGELDMAFVEGTVTDPQIVKEVIGDDELVVVTANEELASREWFIDELAERRWVLREEGSGTREVFLEYIKDKVPRLNVFLELGHTESIKSLLKSGKALTCLSAFAVRKEIESGELRVVPIRNFHCTRNFYAIYHKDKYRSELFEKFLQFSKEMIGEVMEHGCCHNPATV
ncbi:LysR family transcriptional regulator [Nitratifractor sp.]